MHSPTSRWAFFFDTVPELPRFSGLWDFHGDDRIMQAQVALVMGSNSDLPKLEKALGIFQKFGIGCEVRILSAHRTPHAVEEFASGAKARGVKVIIAAAGGAAHLAGVIASYTVLPVIGIPITLPDGMGGLDSLLSMAQMPAGIPVAVMSTGGGGAENAALLAISILAVNDILLAEALESHRRDMADKVLARDSALQWKLTDPDRSR